MEGRNARSLGKGLGRPLISYLDTNVTVWLAQGNVDRLSAAARTQIESSELFISPVVLLELEYLYEVGRIVLAARDVQSKLANELGVSVCRHGFPSIVSAALQEKWTRDPFDRIIVAHAKANGLAPLVSSDAEIRKSYTRAVW
jgi:PIN domain nuclease of toxin-antitoxin system